MTHGKRVALLISTLALLLSACELGQGGKAGEAAKDNAPADFTGTVLLKYGPEVPITTDKAKCSFGSYSVQSADGAIVSVCALSQAEYDRTAAGTTYTR